MMWYSSSSGGRGVCQARWAFTVGGPSVQWCSRDETKVDIPPGEALVVLPTAYNSNCYAALLSLLNFFVVFS